MLVGTYTKLAQDWTYPGGTYTNLAAQWVKILVPIHSLIPQLFFFHSPNIWKFWYQKSNNIWKLLCVKWHEQNLCAFKQISEKLIRFYKTKSNINIDFYKFLQTTYNF